MAVTASDLAIELRLSVDGEDDLEEAQTTVLERLISVADSLVTAYASSAPDDVKDEATIRCAAYLFDVPAGSANAPQNAMMYCGAHSLLSPWRVQRAWILGGSEPEDLSDDEEDEDIE